MKQNFVKTSDELTANQLKEAGFSFIQKDGNVWTFLNNSTIKFSENEIKNISYTNLYNC